MNYPKDFETYWQQILDEEVETPAYNLKPRRDLYTEQCLEDWKQVVFRQWKQYVMYVNASRGT